MKRIEHFSAHRLAFAAYLAALGGCASPETPTKHRYVAVSAGWDFTCAVRDDHSLWCWGQLTGPLNATGFVVPQQITTETDWTGVWSGFIRMCASKSDGSIWCWSWDEERLEGVNYTTIMKQTPQEVPASGEMPAFGAFVPGAALQSCLADTDGGLWCWGPNVFGEVGNGTTSPVASPTSVPGGPWRSTSVGGDDVCWAGAHTCAINGARSLFCWGSDVLDQLGVVSSSSFTTPASVGTAEWNEVGTGTSFTCGIRADGTIWCWGHSFDPNSSDMTTQPWQVSAETDWHGLSAGASMACALRGDASAWCWGNGFLGSAGAPSISNSPLKVGGVDSWSSLSVGLNQACGLDHDSFLWCWGANTLGQVGNGSSATDPEPTSNP